MAGLAIYSVRDFGGVGDGMTDNTDAINNAIAVCAENGGGTVYLNAGTYVIYGAIEHKAGVQLKGLKRSRKKPSVSRQKAAPTTERAPSVGAQSGGRSRRLRSSGRLDHGYDSAHNGVRRV